MRFLLLISFLFLYAPSVWADDVSDGLRKVLCHQREDENGAGHKNADVGADYVPGVDVHGNAVVPADLNGGIDFPPVVIPITVDLAQRFGISLPAGVELKPDVGQMEIFQDGRILFNGRDISEKIRTYCDGDDPGKTADETEKPHGQKDNDHVGSGDVIEGEYPENAPRYND